MSTKTARPYRLITLHDTGPSIGQRVRKFASPDAAVAAAKSTSPDIDGSMVPNVQSELITEENYYQGFYWLGNRYAVIIDIRGIGAA